MGQTLIVFAIVLLAAGYVGLKFFRTARAASSDAAGCDSGCGCAGPVVNNKRHA